MEIVVFDLDDTIYPEREYIRSGYNAVAQRLRSVLDCDRHFDRWLWERFLTGETDGAFDALDKKFDLHLTADGIAELVDVYRLHKPAIHPRTGMVSLIENLSASDSCKLAILSDGFLPAQQLKLDALGIENLFDMVVFTEKLGRDCWKPSVKGFVAIQSAFDVSPSSCVYIGDNPAKDFAGPNDLGWHTIQLLLPEQIHSGKSAPPAGMAKQTVNSLSKLQVSILTIPN